jgi:hypothetical protein
MKKTINSILLICLIVSIMAVFIPSSAYACSCAQPAAVEAEFGRSETVFAGRAIEVKELRNLNGSMMKSALFEIGQIWKGGPESQIIIYTGGGGGDCGYHFEEGREYLVYAYPSTMYGNKERLVTIICNRTDVLAQAQADLVVLGEAKLPTQQVNLQGGLNLLYPYRWAIVLGIAAIGALIFFVQRR